MFVEWFVVVWLDFILDVFFNTHCFRSGLVLACSGCLRVSVFVVVVAVVVVVVVVLFVVVVVVLLLLLLFLFLLLLLLSSTHIAVSRFSLLF